jgi:multiple sugar transport system substrate-binding protein
MSGRTTPSISVEPFFSARALTLGRYFRISMAARTRAAVSGATPPRAVVEETGLAPTPVGPSGKRANMYNGLADSIWVGAKNKPGAAKWVEFLGSPDCQNIVGEKAVVFPAIPEATEKAEAAWKAKGIDTTPFTIQVDEKTTFLFPITDYASQITGIMTPAMDEVLTGKSPPESLTEANNQVNQLFG